MKEVKRYLTNSLLAVVLSLLATSALAGDLNAPAAPTNPASAMFTLEDLYNRLLSGTAGTKRPGSFAEPGAAPGSTMHNLNDIMDKAPTVDGAGAIAADVLTGKTFWGLTAGAWGSRAGSMPNNGAVTITPGTADQAITAGYHSGSGKVLGDANLTTGNIKAGVTIFGVAGTYVSASVPKTGQTVSRVARDDGALRKGVPWPNPRFTDNGNGTVSDNLTGLIWLKHANFFMQSNWTGQLSNVANLNNGDVDELGGGFTLQDGSNPGDWRVPSVRELQSLVDYGYHNPCLCNTAGTSQWTAGNPFTNVRYGASDKYWSSTGRASFGTTFWAVSLFSGEVVYDADVSNCFVLPVRGGQ